jgi:hypothetical protein
MRVSDLVHVFRPYTPWGIAFFGFFLHLALFWPGILSADSYFLQWVPGAGLMLTFHLLLFWAAIGLFSYTLFKYKIRSWWWFYFIPVWPVFLCYSSMIWKDVGFSFSFLCAISILCHCHFLNKKPTFLQSGMIVILLGYGVGVKYQATYILPVSVFWLSYLIFNKKPSQNTFLLTAGIIFCILGSEKYIVFKI